MSTPAAPDFDASTTLALLVECDQAIATAEAAKLAAIAHFCDLHPVLDPDHVPAGPTDRSLLGDVSRLPLAGDGTPQVRDTAIHELSAALGLSHQATLALVGQTLELRHRLPKLWDLVHDLTLPAWQARKVAAETTALSREAAAFVDTHLTVDAARGRLTMATVRSAIRLAETRFEPADTRTDEEADLASCGVWFDTDPRRPVTTEMHARLDTLCAQALDVRLSALATTLGRLGDPTSLDQRRATALGLLADPQAVLDLEAGRTDHAATAAGADGHLDRPVRPVEQSTSRVPATLYLHIDAADLDNAASAEPEGGGTVERLGAATLARLQTWLERVGKVTVRPVLDVDRETRLDRAVDRHDPPQWMHDLVTMRDKHCVFPGCRTDARACDLDHIEPYRPPDPGDDRASPPGQTRPSNLAPLCRRHHRQKTHHGWRYRRGRDGYHWTSPLGMVHLVPHLA